MIHNYCNKYTNKEVFLWKKKLRKGWTFWSFIGVGIIAIILCLLMIFFQIKNNSTISELESECAKYKSIVQADKSKIESKDTKIAEQEDKINELSQTDKINELNTEVKTLETKVTELSSKKQGLESEIEKLNGDVIKVKGEPKTYPAGHLTAGTDVPTGK